MELIPPSRDLRSTPCELLVSPETLSPVRLERGWNLDSEKEMLHVFLRVAKKTEKSEIHPLFTIPDSCTENTEVNIEKQTGSIQNIKSLLIISINLLTYLFITGQPCCAEV